MTQQIQWRKPVCQLDSDGLFTGMTHAELDVYARDGSYLIPGGCIDTVAPEIPQGKAARWNGEGWDVIDDHRGKSAYRTDTGEAVVIERAGALSDGLTLQPQPSPAHEWNGNKWVENKTLAKELAAQALTEAKAAKLAELNRAAQARIIQAAGIDKVPEFEVQSWAIQAAEAKAWQADKTAATPVLNQIAAVRGVPAETLKAAALRKTLAYELLAATVAGQRQALQTKIEQAADLETLAAVEIRFAMPSENE